MFWERVGNWFGGRGFWTNDDLDYFEEMDEYDERRRVDSIDVFRMGMEASEDAEMGYEETALGLVPDSSLEEDDEEEIEGVEYGLGQAEYLEDDDDDEWEEDLAF